MAYTKTAWINEEGTDLNKFSKTNETTTDVTLTRNPSSITQAGTVFNVINMNKIEQGLDDIFNNATTIAGNKTFSGNIIQSGGTTSLKATTIATSLTVTGILTANSTAITLSKPTTIGDPLGRAIVLNPSIFAGAVVQSFVSTGVAAIKHYFIGYGSDHPSEPLNFAIKNTIGDLFFTAGNNEFLRSDGSAISLKKPTTITGALTASADNNRIGYQSAGLSVVFGDTFGTTDRLRISYNDITAMATRFDTLKTSQYIIFGSHNSGGTLLDHVSISNNAINIYKPTTITGALTVDGAIKPKRTTGGTWDNTDDGAVIPRGVYFVSFNPSLNSYVAIDDSSWATFVMRKGNGTNSEDFDQVGGLIFSDGSTIKLIINGTGTIKYSKF